ncbi:MAG: hypothetical protein PHI40_06365 [Caldisericia bacterium]|nr:hypothetical protein [Caldisericia bacterium]MDD4615012.1 hypothetical protein [Caldisericia bacterium]
MKVIHIETHTNKELVRIGAKLASAVQNYHWKKESSPYMSLTQQQESSSMKASIPMLEGIF